jgi:hypothetical protein
MSFIQDHQKNLATVRLKYSGQQLSKPITLTLRPSAFFTFTANDADETKAKNICRRLAGALAKASGDVATPVADTFASQVASAMGDMLAGDAQESPAPAPSDSDQVDLSSPTPAPAPVSEEATAAAEPDGDRPDPVGEMADLAAAETDQSSAAA